MLTAACANWRGIAAAIVSAHNIWCLPRWKSSTFTHGRKAAVMWTRICGSVARCATLTRVTARRQPIPSRTRSTPCSTHAPSLGANIFVGAVTDCASSAERRSAEPRSPPCTSTTITSRLKSAAIGWPLAGIPRNKQGTVGNKNSTRWEPPSRRGRRLGINLDKSERARKVGNEFAG